MKPYRLLKTSLYCCIVIISSFLFSCEEPDTIGMGVQPSSDKLNVEYCDSVSLFAHSVKEDSVRTDESVYNLLGYSDDPVFGKTSSSFYSQFRLSSNNASFGTNPVLDSIVVSFAYKGIYGDSNAQQTVQVYELAEDMHKDSIYYSNKEFLTTGTLLASKTFVPNVTDSVTIDGLSLAPQLRIPLSASFGQKFIDASGTTSLADNSNFLDFFKGLYITTTAATGEGAIISFNPLSSQSKITLYYHNDSDTTGYNFIINENCARVNHFNHSNYQYADDFLRSQLYSDTTKGDSIIYIQSMAGLKVRITYPFIQDLLKNGRIAINKAELIAYVENNDESYQTYGPPTQLFLMEELDGKIRYLSELYGGSYDASSKKYTFNISRHLQQILDGVKENIGLYMLVYTGDRPNKANRVILNGPKRQTNKLQLQITYTKLY